MKDLIITIFFLFSIALISMSIFLFLVALLTNNYGALNLKFVAILFFISASINLGFTSNYIFKINNKENKKDNEI